MIEAVRDAARDDGRSPEDAEMGHSALYDDDILLWSEEQAEIIRRLGRARRDLPNELDIENVAEEIESVGRSEMASVESFLRLMMLHLIKIASVPEAKSVPHWRDEARNLSLDALTWFAPSMAQRIDMDRIWRLACDQATASLDEHGDPVVRLPARYPWTIAELVREQVDLNSLIAKLRTDEAPHKPSDRV